MVVLGGKYNIRGGGGGGAYGPTATFCDKTSTFCYCILPSTSEAYSFVFSYSFLLGIILRVYFRSQIIFGKSERLLNSFLNGPMYGSCIFTSRTRWTKITSVHLYDIVGQANRNKC